MLPTETFAEAIAFLRLFDLGALVVTNALYSSLAVKASTHFRCEEFSGLLFYVWNRSIEVFRLTNDASLSWKFVTAMTFSTVDDTAEFVVAAFPNCIFEHVSISNFLSVHLLDAIGRIADSVIIKGVLLVWALFCSFVYCIFEDLTISSWFSKFFGVDWTSRGLRHR